MAQRDEKLTDLLAVGVAGVGCIAVQRWLLMEWWAFSLMFAIAAPLTALGFRYLVRQQGESR